MKRKTFLFTAISQLLLLGVIGCEKKEQGVSIEGKWRLIKKQQGCSEEKTFEINDFLCIFNPNGLVEVKTTIFPSLFYLQVHTIFFISDKVIVIDNKQYEFNINANQ